MSAITKKKLCWNCEGRVSQQEENCSFCGVYLNGTLQGQKQDTDHLFSKKRKNNGKEEEHLPPYIPEEEEPVIVPEEKEKLIVEEVPSVVTKMAVKNLNKEFVTLLFLLSGSILLLFSFILLLFSTNGVFTLQWNADFWFVYLIASLPLLFFGWRYLSQLQSNEE